MNFQELKIRVADKFIEHGLNKEDALILGDYFATVEFYGVSSHGVKTLAAHLKKLDNNGYNTDSAFTVEKETAAFAKIDGGSDIGMLSAIKCVDYALKKVKESGVFTVFSPNNNTFGAAFYYALRAAKEGCICLVASNSPAQMAPMGGKEKLLGTNPFAIGIPAFDEHPIICDMATSIVAKSKFNYYKANNLPIPDGWALDVDGNPTTDAEKALAGLILPMAGYKGYAIAMMIDIISGVLSNAAYLNKVGRFYDPENRAMNVGFTFTVIDPKAVYGEGFYAEMDEYIKIVKTSESIGEKTVSLPGDDRIKAFEQNLIFGLEIDELR